MMSSRDLANKILAKLTEKDKSFELAERKGILSALLYTQPGIFLLNLVITFLLSFFMFSNYGFIFPSAIYELFGIIISLQIGLSVFVLAFLYMSILLKQHPPSKALRWALLIFPFLMVVSILIIVHYTNL